MTRMKKTKNQKWPLHTLSLSQQTVPRSTLPDPGGITLIQGLQPLTCAVSQVRPLWKTSQLPLLCFKPNSWWQSWPKLLSESWWRPNGVGLSPPTPFPLSPLDCLGLCSLQLSLPQGEPAPQLSVRDGWDKVGHTYSIPLSFGRSSWRSRWKRLRTLNSPNSFSEGSTLFSPHWICESLQIP